MLATSGLASSSSVAGRLPHLSSSSSALSTSVPRLSLLNRSVVAGSSPKLITTVAKAPATKLISNAPAPFRGKTSFLVKMIAKSMLLYSGAEFTVDEFVKSAPKAVQALRIESVYEVLKMLMGEGLVSKVDANVETEDPECIYEKEQNAGKLAGLAFYGVTIDAYRKSCE